MGVVYRVYVPQLRREVAIKLLSPGPREDNGHGWARLLREVPAMARLSHPNVLPVFEAGEYDEQLCIVMELCRGGNDADMTRAAASACAA